MMGATMASNVIHRRVFLGTPLAVFATTFFSAAIAAEEPDPLDGYWEGSLENVTGPGIDPPPTTFGTIRLFIRGETAKVFMEVDGAWIEIGAGTFNVAREGTNAVITSIQSDLGSRRGTSWVETWTFVVTLWNTDTLMVNYNRMVNNNGMVPEEEQARFTQIQTGRLRRSYPAHV
jgi:hypothetical protein